MIFPDGPYWLLRGRPPAQTLREQRDEDARLQREFGPLWRAAKWIRDLPEVKP